MRSKKGERPAGRRPSRQTELLEARRMLSGTHQQALLDAVTAALEPTAVNAQGVAAWAAKLDDASALGRSLPLVGTGLGSAYNPSTALNAVLNRLSTAPSPYTSVAALAGAVEGGPGLSDGATVTASRDLPDDVELDLQLRPVSSVQVPVAATFGTDFVASGTLTVTTTLSVGLTVGAYWDPATNSAVAYVNDNDDQISLTAAATAVALNPTATLGFVDLTISSAAAAFSPTFAFTFNPEPPTDAAQAADRVTVAQLIATPAPAAIATTVSQAAPTSLAVNFSTSLAPAAHQVTFTWPDVNNPANVSSTLRTDPSLATLSALAAIAPANFSGGLDQLADLLNDAAGAPGSALGTPLPLVNESIATAVNLPTTLQSALLAHTDLSAATGAAPFQTAGQLLAVLQNTAGIGTANVTESATATDVRYTVKLQVTQSSTPALSLGIGAQLPLDVTASANLTVASTLTVTFGVNTANTFFVVDTGTPAFTAVATVTGSVNTATTLGYLGVTLAGGTFAETAAAAVALHDPNTDAPATPGLITAAELVPANLATLATTTLSGTASATLPLAATPAANFTAPAPGTLKVAWPDVNHPAAFTLDTSTVTPLVGFAQITPATVSAGLTAVGGVLANAADPAALGRSLAVIGSDLGTVSTVGQTVQSAVSSLSSVTTIQGLVAALNASLGYGNFTASTTSTGLQLDLTARQTYGGTQPFSVGGSALGVGLQASGSAGFTFALMAHARAALSFAQTNGSTSTFTLDGGNSALSAAFAANLGGLAATGSVGFKSITVNGGSATIGGPGGTNATVSIPLNAGTAGAQLTTAQLTGNPLGTFGPAAVTGSATVTLPITGLATTGPTPQAVFTFASLSNPTAASVVLTPNNLDLTSAATFAVNALTGGVQQIINLVGSFSTLAALNTDIPLLNTPISSLVDFVGMTKGVFQSILNAGPTTAASFNSAVLNAAAAAGLPASVVSLTAASANNPGGNVFDYVLSFHDTVAAVNEPFNFGGSLFTVNTTLQAGVTFNTHIEFGFDQADGFYVLASPAGTPALSLSATVTGNIAQAGGTFGPFTVGVANGVASATFGAALNLTGTGKIPASMLATGLAAPTLTGSGHLLLPLGFQIGPGGPGVTTSFEADWNPADPNSFTYGSSASTNPTDGFGPVNYDLGEFVNGIVGPVLSDIQQFDPIPKQVLDAINYELPVVGKSVGDILGGLTGQPALSLVLQIAGVIGDIPTGADTVDLHKYLPNLPDVGDAGGPNGTPAANGSIQPATGPLGNFDAFKSFQQTLENNFYLSLPILDNPTGSILRMLVGQDVDLVTFNPGHLSLTEGYEAPPIRVPLFSIGIADVEATIGGGFSVSLFANIDLGLTTRGLFGHDIGAAHNLLDGFYIDNTAAEQIGLTAEGHISLGGDIAIFGFPIVELSGQVGPYVTVGAKVNDVSYNAKGVPIGPASYMGNPPGDGRTYLDELQYLAGNYGPECAVMPVGQLGLRVGAEASVGFGPFQVPVLDVSKYVPIFDYDTACQRTLATLATLSGNQLVMSADSTPVGEEVSAAVYDDANGNPAGIQLVRADDSTVLYQQFTFAQLAGVNSVVLTGTAGDDSFLIDPNITEPATGGIRYLTVLSGNGNDTVNLENLTAANSQLLGTTVAGGNGTDTIDGTYAPGLITLGNGANAVFSGTGNDTVTATGGKDTIRGGNGNDLVNGGTNTEQIYLGDGNDTVYGGNGTDTTSAGNGNDDLYGGSGPNVINVGNGTDLVAGGLGSDCVQAGDGQDKIYGGSAGNGITVGAGEDVIYGGPGNDRIVAGGGNDFVNPGTGRDTVDGGTGRTLLVTGVDANQTLANTTVTYGNGLGTTTFSRIATVALNGGVGNEAFDVSAWTAGPVAVNGGGGLDTLVAHDDADFTLTDAGLTRSDGVAFSFTNVAAVNLAGGASDNTFDVTAYHGAGTLTGAGGIDTIVANNLTVATLTDTSLARAGATTLTVVGTGRASLGTVARGGATVSAAGYGGAVALFAFGNANTLTGGTGSDYLSGGTGTANVLTALGTLDNQITGGTGSGDTIRGGPGTNLLVGATGGGDTITVGTGPTRVYTPGGSDAVHAETGGATVYAGTGNDAVYTGTSATDTVLHPGDVGTVAADFVPPAATLWTVPPVPAVPGTTLPTGPTSLGQWVEFGGSASGGGVSNSTGVAVEPTVATFGTTQYVAWADNRSGTYEIYVARHTAAGWQELAGSAHAGGVSNSIVDARRPSITTDAAGNPIVAWTQAGDILAARYNSTSGTWVSLGNVSGDGSADNAKLVYAAAGPTVAWLDRSTGHANAFVKQYNGSAWAALGGSANVSASAVDVAGVSVATDGTRVAVAWTQSSNIYLKQYAGGTWSAVNGSASGFGISGGAIASMPTVAYFGGTLVSAWVAVVNGASNVVAAANAGGGWAAVSIDTPASAGMGQTSRGAASAPTLAASSAGLDLVWFEDRLVGTPGDAVAVYAARWSNGAFVRQLPGDASFDGILHRSTTLSSPATLAVAVDGSGHPFVALGDASSGSSQVYALADPLDVHNVYYVNDNLTATDAYTTASGLSTNTGLSPNSPLPSVQSVLNLGLQAGDVILVDSGAQAGFTGTSADNGVLILGQPGGQAVVNSAVALNGVQNVTLQGLTLAGGLTVTGGSNIELSADTGAAATITGATNVTVEHVALAGLTLAGTTTNVTVANDTLTGTGLTVGGTGTTGLLVTGDTLSAIALIAPAAGSITGNNVVGGSLDVAAAFTGPITGNLIHGFTGGTGVVYAAPALLNNNRVFGNLVGVTDSVTGPGGLGFVAGSTPNQIYGNATGVSLSGSLQGQHVWANGVGVAGSGTLGGTSLDAANLIEANGLGVNVNGTVQYNRIDRNGTAIDVYSGQLIAHNLIYKNVGPGIETLGATDVRIVSDTFYSAPGGINVSVDGGSSNVQLLNDVLWATGTGGYDVSVATDSRVGFFSDYNDLYTTAGADIVRWLVDFTDVLDWRDALGTFDLHSAGTTAVNPTGAQPQFVDASLDDYRVFGPAAGIRSTSPTANTGDPFLDLALPPSYANLLVDPSFESGTTGWAVNPSGTTQSGNPPTFDGTSYFYAGPVAAGFAQQTVSLTAAGFTAAQIDGQTLVVSFGGRIRSAAEPLPDQGLLTLTFVDGGGNAIGSADTLSASNSTDRWELVGDRVHVPAGARGVTYRFSNLRESGSTDDSYLDGAFLYVLPDTVSPDTGAYGDTAADLARPKDQHIQLESPDLYVNWTLNQPHTIQWQTVGNDGGGQVRIDLYSGSALVTTIAAATPDTGSYVWVPANSGLTYGTYGLRIQVSLVNTPAVRDRSTETFTVPENGNTYYVNDGSTAGDEYSTAAGNNRATGKVPGAPIPLLTTLLRTYALGAADKVYVDTGTYGDFAAVEISGNPTVGTGQGVTIAGPINHAATIQPLGFTSPALIDVNAANYVTITHLSFAGGDYGVWVRNGSTNFTGTYLTATGQGLGGIRLESDAVGSTLDHLVVSATGGDGVYAGGNVVAVTHSTSYNNAGAGFDLPNAGNAVLTGDVAYADNDGFDVSNSTAGTATAVGNATLALGLGDVAHDNRRYGFNAAGGVSVAGDTAYGQLANTGVNLTGGATAAYDVSYNNAQGFTTDGGAISYSRAYGNSGYGLYANNSPTLQGDVSYANAVGIRIFTAPNYGQGPFVYGDLVYGNSTQGIWLTGGASPVFTGNTVYQTAGDALKLDPTYVGAVNVHLEDNVLWDAATGGYAIDLDKADEVGFVSDYNDLYATAGGQVGRWEDASRPTLQAWRAASNADAHSLSADPLFVNAAAGDYHVQSTTGSSHGGSLAPVVNPATSLPVAAPGTLTADANESPTIDRGDATFSYANEPKPNGGFVNLGAFGNTAQASLSPVSYVLVLVPSGGDTLVAGQTVALTWRSQDTAGTANLDLLVAGSSTPVLSIAAGVPNSGTYSWTVPTTLAAGTNYVLRVTRLASPTAVGVSGVFSIAGPTHAYYLNDASVLPGDYTTAAGNDANSGLDPAHPKASLQALFAAYTLGTGDVILVDDGTYPLTSNVVLTAAQSGVTIRGYVNVAYPTRATVLSRANTNAGSYVFDLQAAVNVTLDRLTVTGGYYGVDAAYNAVSTGLTVSNSTFTGSQSTGVYLDRSNGGATITGNTFHDMLGGYGNRNTGLDVTYDVATVTNNVAYNLGSYGLELDGGGPGTVVSGNTTYNDVTGIAVGTGVVSGNVSYNNATGIYAGGGSTVVGNTAYNDVGTGNNAGTGSGIEINGATATGNVAYASRVGILIDSGTAANNLVYGNTIVGITGGNGAVITGNVIRNNAGWGTTSYSYPSGATGGPAITGNLVYGNTTGGIYLNGGDHTGILNNTVYQTTGNAVQIDSSGGGLTATDVEVRDNILWTTNGTDLKVDPAVQPQFAGDYNDLYATGSGTIGVWNGVTYTTLAGWQNASNQDADSLGTDPLFVATGTDFHVQSQYGSYHGGTLAPVLATTGLPAANPGTLTVDANQSPTIDRGSPADPYAAEPTPNGGYVNLGSYGDSPQASLSPAEYVTVTSPNGGQTLLAGQAVPITYRSATTPVNTALLFNGVNDYVAVPDAPSLRPASFTFEAAAAFNALPGNPEMIAAKNLGTGSAESFGLYYQGRTLTADVVGSTNSAAVYYNWTPQLGHFYTFAVSYDDPTGTLTMYVDGVAVASQQNTGVHVAYDSRPLTIGSEYENNVLNFFFNGEIDDVREWGVTRTAAQVAADVTTAVTGAEPGLAAAYTFNENGGTTAHDLTANHNDAAVGGGNPAAAPGFVSRGASGTVTIQLLQGTTVTATIATAAPNTGTYLWTVPTGLPSATNYTVRVTTNDVIAATDTSDAPFAIAGRSSTFYVNDGSVQAGDYTTAAGNDANTGLDPAHPKATLASVLRSYTLRPGDVVLVDRGTYSLPSNLVLTAADNGVTIDGLSAAATVLTRGNLNNGSYGFDVQGAAGVTIENLSVTAAYNGINAASNAGSTGLTVANCAFYGEATDGIFLDAGNGGATITGSTFHDNGGGYRAEGLVANGLDTFANDTAYNLLDGFDLNGGATLTNCVAYNDTDAGVVANGGSVVTGNTVYNCGNAGINEANCTVTGNAVSNTGGYNTYPAAGIEYNGGTISGNVSHGNAYGLFGGGGTVSDNRVYGNSAAGVESGNGTTLAGNDVYSNGTFGIQATGGVTIRNNLVYANGTAGIQVSTNPSYYGPPLVLSNTVYQLNGDALQLSGGPTTVRDNVLWTAGGGFALDVDDPTSYSLASDYNDLYATGTSQVAAEAGHGFASLAAWVWETGFDPHSRSADPQFANAAGPDGTLGYAGGVDHGTDDNFHVAATSPTIDAGNPTDPYFNEPAPNGGRVNQGSYGNTAGATAGSAIEVQVLSPNGLNKLEAGHTYAVGFRSAGLSPVVPVVQLDARGGPAAPGWSADDAYVTGRGSTQTTATTVTAAGLADPAPAGVLSTYDQGNYGSGNALSYALPVPNGSYTLALYFVEPADAVGNRLLSIIVNGQTVRTNLDINAAAGGIGRAVELTFPATAAGGTGVSVKVVNQTNEYAILSGLQLFTRLAVPTSPTANVDVSTDNGGTWTRIGTNVPTDEYGNGTLNWTPTTTTAGNTGLVRVTESGTTGTSAQPFSVANGGTDYYVNDASAAGDSLTTAVGDNAAEGKSPSQPMASVEAVLNSYHPAAGSVIHVDNGTYTLFHTIVIPGTSAGITIQGPTAGGAAVINRGNLNDDVIDLGDGAGHVTLDHLSLTGGNAGVDAPYENNGVGIAAVTVSNDAIYGNHSYGVNVGNNDQGWTVTGNVIHDNSVGYGDNGVEIDGDLATITNNVIYNQNGHGIVLTGGYPSVVSGNTTYGDGYGIDVSGSGIVVSGNVAHDNATVGIYGEAGALVVGNTAYRQTATNAVGIEVSAAEARGNAVFGNYYGITTNSYNGNATIDGNRVYSNANWGIYSVGYDGFSRPAAKTIDDNLVYANAGGGIYVASDNYGNGTAVLNNTVYQPANDALHLQSDPGDTVEGNVLYVQAGYALYVSTDSQTGLVSDYNLLYHGAGASGFAGYWNGANQPTLAAFRAASGEDAHSTESDPLFVDPAGADATLGYNAAANNGAGVDFGADDNFFLNQHSPAIDAGNAAVAPTTDLLGYARADDPGTLPNGSAYPDLGAYEFRGNSTATGPFTVTGVTVLPGFNGVAVTLSGLPNDVDARATSLYELRGAGPDGKLNTADDVIYPVVATYTPGSQQVVLTVTGGPLPVGGLYQLTIRSAALASLHDVSGIPLDGDFNGTPGGNFVDPFTLNAPTPATIAGPAEYLRLDPDGVHLDVYANSTGTGSPAQQLVLSQVSTLTVTGTAGNDSLTVDFSAGNPVPTGGLTFNGLAGVNALHVIGTAGDDAVSVGSSTVTVGSAVLTYANTQAITFAGNGGADTVTQVAPPGGGAALSLVNPTAAETLNVSSGTYTFAASAAGSGVTPVALATLDIGAGATVVVASAASPADRYVILLGGLNLAGSLGNWQGRFDVGNNDLVVHGGNLATINDVVRSGLSGNGNGIASTAAAADPRRVTTLAAILNGGTAPLYGSGAPLGLFDGQNPAAADVLVKYTYYGDANLDGKVNGVDYARLDAGYAAAGGLTGWYNGDFDYSGTVDGSDYTLIDNAFDLQGTTTPAGTTLNVTTGTTTIPAGVAGGGVHRVVYSGVTIANGAKVVVVAPATPADRTLVVTPSLSLAGSAQLDLTGNDLIVPGGNLAQVTALAAAGYAGGTWAGPGLDSGSAAGDPARLHALGVVANDDGAGNRLYGTGTALGLLDAYDPARGDVLVRYTLYGDANLDGKIDGTDYARIDAGYIGGLTGWANGDFNYDGRVDASDYTLIDNAFNEQGPFVARSSAEVATRAAAATPAVPHSATPFATTGVITDDDRNKSIAASVVDAANRRPSSK